MNTKTVSFYTLGCKLNFSETSTISRDLESEGFAKVDFEIGADIYIINTCSVTDQADKKCRNIVRKALRYNPSAFIIVIGCYAQLKPKEISKIQGVNLVLGAQEKFNISKYLKSNLDINETILMNEPIKNVKTFYPGYSLGDRTRSFFKIQDGCNYFCSFCTIPLARGKSRSGNIKETVLKAKEIGRSEVKEVVLTGVNIGDFGNGTNENFQQLIKQLDILNGISRYRISSIEPDLLKDEIIEFVYQSNKFTPHFHIPLQSGSDTLLKEMRRRYDTTLYAKRIQLIKELMPQACIGVDVIVGFPGETEEEFNKTVDFLKSLPISYLHVFTYSERANTTAPRKEQIIPMEIRRKRSKQLRILSLKLKLKFYSDNVGYIGNVLFETHEGNFLIGFTENYIKVKVPYKPGILNTIQKVKIEKISSDIEAYGNLINQKINIT
ncbi:MAG: tRNA (N(6)-L-threonylcarbamoyladenosine(37)-C(2))-methylthiotransferase MtaB [Crocinitomicaceae bacterium]|nr:tRNA (N(6)-L-threonylcarbamoyladenosine(37)-C(2))-methylthiotransferase MtaB [Crocinitomicaceae bacterium]|tara:strand:+ start:3973 stop:5286 length:1314 start_codon:yes stop_codon:yes gene_type:complete